MPGVGPVQILVVDDEEPIRNALKKFLAQQQYEVYTASTGDEALQALRRHLIALMLCDIRMPGTSGVDLVPQALETQPDLAILMLTAVNDATTAALCMRMSHSMRAIRWRRSCCSASSPEPAAYTSNCCCVRYCGSAVWSGGLLSLRAR